MLKVKAVAQRLSLSVSAVYALIENGELPHYRLGANGHAAIRVSEDQLKEFLAGREKKPEQGDQPRKRKPPRPQLRHLKLS